MYRKDVHGQISKDFSGRGCIGKFAILYVDDDVAQVGVYPVSTNHHGAPHLAGILFTFSKEYTQNIYRINIAQNIQYTQDMKKRGTDVIYNKFIGNMYVGVTAPTLRNLFGFILNDDGITYDEFMNPAADDECFTLRTKWIHKNDHKEDIRCEKYLSKCVAPTSVIMWFWRRTGQDSWLPSLLLTDYHYQSYDQFAAYIRCGFDFYTKERYIFYINIYSISIFYIYSEYIHTDFIQWQKEQGRGH